MSNSLFTDKTSNSGSLLCLHFGSKRGCGWKHCYSATPQTMATFNTTLSLSSSASFSTSSQSVFSCRVVDIDYYLTSPVKGLDVSYSDFAGEAVQKVPVIRVFGATPVGQKACVHVHGVFPYLYVPCVVEDPTERCVLYLCIHPTIYSVILLSIHHSTFVHPSIHLFIHLSIILSYISIRLSIHAIILHPSIYTSIQFIHSYIHYSIIYLHSSISTSLYPSIIQSYIFIYLFVHPSIQISI